MGTTTDPVIRAEMLIRRPVEDVYEAFVNPEITSRFWFTRSTGPLVEGQTVTWFWEMYGVSGDVEVKSLEPNRRILIHWPTPVEWLFDARKDGTTYVSIIVSEFSGSDDEKVAQAIDSQGGFSLALAGCKALLEHGIELNLVADHKPDAHVA